MSCTCESTYTCGHCLSNAPPWHWTPPATETAARRDAAILRERAVTKRRLAESANPMAAAILIAEAETLEAQP